MESEKLFKELKTEISELIKEKFGEESSTVKNEIAEFVDESREKLQRWTLLFASGQISKDELELLLASQKDLFVMQSLYQTGVSKISLGHFKNKVVGVVFTKIVTYVV
ncbi:hypothetical protein [Kriegella aquimaris]|uniref:Uncharacterized protein n=1 Tax=Kriegella aquimaris TaxID=192904 RepID=A0A1G9N7Y9_9FLAO|nr:hypothetical protein [Kriegella aquimaris]SDL82646.1 hypothetical protein SAMN04488514_10370 [Kriegella aquimaris]